MRICEIIWDDDTVSHLARHGVEPGEAEEVCFVKNLLARKARANRYIALGQTESGRYLTIVFEYLGQNKAKVITARAMAEAERKLYKRS